MVYTPTLLSDGPYNLSLSLLARKPLHAPTQRQIAIETKEYIQNILKENCTEPYSVQMGDGNMSEEELKGKKARVGLWLPKDHAYGKNGENILALPEDFIFEKGNRSGISAYTKIIRIHTNKILDAVTLPIYDVSFAFSSAGADMPREISKALQKVKDDGINLPSHIDICGKKGYTPSQDSKTQCYVTGDFKEDENGNFSLENAALDIFLKS